MNANILINFMKRLIKDPKRKKFLILENLRALHAKAAKAWLTEHKDDIKVL